MNVLVTGVTGFVGHALVEPLISRGHKVSALVRHITPALPEQVKQTEVGDLTLKFQGGTQDPEVWDAPSADSTHQHGHQNQVITALKEADVLVHLAARVHIMNDKATDPLTEFRKANTDMTLGVARLAAKMGVKRFIFLSTLKVNGESTTGRLPFTEEDVCQPSDPYAMSKMEAEKGLVEIAENTGMELVIIRPPLIYGRGVKGNFASMMRWLARGIPLPLGAVHNQRSLLALDNLVDFICHCVEHTRAANEVFLISDDSDISTSELVRKLAHAQGREARLLPVPEKLIEWMAGLLNKKDLADRLLGSLQVDNRKARHYLNWAPLVSMDEQLAKMVQQDYPSLLNEE